MSVLKEFRQAVVAAVGASIPTVQVVTGPPGENTAIKESVWVERTESEFEWRSLGIGQQLLKNRTETLMLDVRVQVYREGPDSLVTQEAAIARCEDLLEQFEAVIAPDPSVADVVTHSRLVRQEITPVAAAHGWIADGRGRVEASNYP